MGTIIGIELSPTGGSLNPANPRMAYVRAEHVNAVEEVDGGIYKSRVYIGSTSILSTENSWDIVTRVEKNIEPSATLRKIAGQQEQSPISDFVEYGMVYVVEDKSGVRRHIPVPNGTPLITSMTDSITGSFLLFQKLP